MILRIICIFILFSSFILSQQIDFHSPQNIKHFGDFLFCEKDYLRAIDEYEKYLAAYGHYFSEYKNNYRYLIDYGNLINAAFVFGVDRLKTGEDVLNQALYISRNYPHAFWALAVNLNYQGQDAGALDYAKSALELDLDLPYSVEIYETLKN